MSLLGLSSIPRHRAVFLCVLLLFCVSLLLAAGIALSPSQRKSRSLALAHSLWQQGRQSEAVALYETLYGPDTQPVLLVGRIVDYYADAGEQQQAHKWIDRAQASQVPVRCETDSGRRLVAAELKSRIARFHSLSPSVTADISQVSLEYHSGLMLQNFTLRLRNHTETPQTVYALVFATNDRIGPDFRALYPEFGAEGWKRLLNLSTWEGLTPQRIEQKWHDSPSGPTGRLLESDRRSWHQDKACKRDLPAKGDICVDACHFVPMHRPNFDGKPLRFDAYQVWVFNLMGKLLFEQVVPVRPPLDVDFPERNLVGKTSRSSLEQEAISEAAEAGYQEAIDLIQSSQFAEARKQLQTLRQNYAGTNAARKAEVRLAGLVTK